MQPSAEEQLVAARPISPPSDQSQYSPPTPTKEPQRFRFSPLKLFPNVRYYLNWREFFKPEKSKIVLSIALFLPLFVRFLLTFIEKNYDVQRTLYTVSLDFTWAVMIEEINDIPLMAFIFYFLLPNIIIIYILSCLIVWVYKKINNNFIVQNLVHADWKKFLKPDMSKIILFVILLIFAYILDNFLVYIGLAGFGSSVRPPPTLARLIFFAVLEILISIIFPLRFVFHFYGTYLVIFNIVYLYCLACSIVWIYRHMKKQGAVKL